MNTTKSTICYQQGNATIHNGDCLDVLRTLPDESVHCCVTSPPYWGLRDYGTGLWKGGNPECDHMGEPHRLKATINKNCGTGKDVKNATQREFFRDMCKKCGAIRVDQQIGLEPTPAEYVANLVTVFREVYRVLRSDGTLWLNLGDSYNGSGGVGGNGKQHTNQGSVDRLGNRAGWPGLKPKDLVGIPWRVAFALQADGWWLRQDIIWHKPNPMPESVRDRCTKAHEYVFLLAKSERYYYDAEAVAEAAEYGHRGSRFDTGKTAEHGMQRSQQGERDDSGTRNRRSVWTVSTKPYSGAHFATMPPDLVEPCILAGCPEGGTILDPFNGAATVGLVALQLQRQYLGIELNPDYCELSVKRIDGVARQKRLFAGNYETHTAPTPA